MNFDENSPVWLTGFWGFSPEDDGFLGYTDERDRNRFLGENGGKRRLVCIYGADSPETNQKLKKQLLGIIDVDCVPIDSWDKISEASKNRNIRAGWADKWRYAMPVRRAWRTHHQISVKDAFPESYKPEGGRYTARYGRWLEPNEARWLLTKVPFREVSVFGELPLPKTDEVPTEQYLDKLLKPSKGVFGGFGERKFNVEDRPHHLYLAHCPMAGEQLAGRHIPAGAGLVKIGISGDLKNRLKALNLSFPENSKIKWLVIRKASFAGRDEAGSAETRFKEQAMTRAGAISLGREFFIMDMKKAEELFNALSPAKGLEIRARSLAGVATV